MSLHAEPGIAATDRWRLFMDDAATHSGGLALDECLAGRVGAGLSAPILRLYTYRDCALVGRFQNVANELHLDACDAAHIPVNRRPTGGGAIVMGPQQLGIALMLPAARNGGFSEARAQMARFADGLVQGLATLGITALFRGKNDLEVEGRKLAGLGVFKHPAGGLLFHASLLVDLDVAAMLRVLKTPFEKITDKEIATVAARTSTVRKETGTSVTVAVVREAVAAGYRGTFGITLVPDAPTAEERVAIERLESEKYLDEAWVFQTPDVADHFGAARVKTPAGLLDVRVTMAGPMIKAAFIAGDFIASDSAVAAMEAALRWHSAEPAAVAGTVEQVHDRWQDGLGGIPRDALCGVLNDAVRQALAGDSAQYGCFVNPQGR